MLPSRKTADAGPGAVIVGGAFGGLEAARSLARHGVKVCVIGSATAVARFSRSVDRFVRLPRKVGDDQLPDFLVAIARKWQLRNWVLFPCSDEHLRAVAQNRSRLVEYFALTAPAWETVRVFYDKRLTYAFAQGLGIPIPPTFVPGQVHRLAPMEIEFPVILKPAVTPHLLAVTGRKAYRAKDRRELRIRFEEMSRVIPSAEIIVQGLIPDPAQNLFSYAGYFRQGEPVAGLSVRRPRQFPRDFGRTSTFVVAVDIPELKDLATRLLRAMRYTGLAEVEFMWSSKRCRFELLDVNGRLWAWNGLAAAAGLDLPYLAYADALGLPFSTGSVRPGAKWVRLPADLRAAAVDRRSGRLSVRQYLNSLRGDTAFALSSRSDPLPFLAEPLLATFDTLRRWLSRKPRGRFPPPGIDEGTLDSGCIGSGGDAGAPSQTLAGDGSLHS
jgi:D-aspartate ligase